MLLPLDLRLAHICHDAWRAYQATQGDTSLPAFAAADEDVIDAALTLVRSIRAGEANISAAPMQLRLYSAVIEELA